MIAYVSTCTDVKPSILKLFNVNQPHVFTRVLNWTPMAPASHPHFYLTKAQRDVSKPHGDITVIWHDLK